MQRTPSTSSRPYRVIRQRPWGAVSWWYSLLFAVPMAILLVMGVARLFSGTASAAEVAVAVTDGVTGQPLQGAIVTVGDQQVTTNDKGVANITRPDDAQAITVQAVDYEPMWGTIDKSSKTDQAVALRSTTVSGVLTDAATGQPIAGARIVVMNADGPTEISATTGADGSYTVKGVPSGATIQAESSAYQTTTSQPNGGTRSILPWRLRQPRKWPRTRQHLRRRRSDGRRPRHGEFAEGARCHEGHLPLGKCGGRSSDAQQHHRSRQNDRIEYGRTRHQRGLSLVRLECGVLQGCRGR